METLSRSARVKRGFDRIAIAGGAIAAICALYWGYTWITDVRSDLIVRIRSETYLAEDAATDRVRGALVAKFGTPEPNPFDKFAPVDRQGSYGPEIADARFDKTMRIHYSRDNTISITLLGLAWVGSVLLISWLIRGFMA